MAALEFCAGDACYSDCAHLVAPVCVDNGIRPETGRLADRIGLDGFKAILMWRRLDFN